MPKEGAFTKAKIVKPGGFGASKSGRFDKPKESCDYTPSASSYDIDAGRSIGARAKKSMSKASLAQRTGSGSSGFGSSQKRGAPISGQSNDAPGPGAYTDGTMKSSFAPKTKGKTSGFGSTPQRQLGSFVPVATPGPGVYAAPDGVGTVKAQNRKGNNSFGGARRFDEPQDVVQADYEIPSAFASKSKSGARNKGFGGSVPRGAPISGQSSDAPGPGSYTALPGAFRTPNTPSSAFASRSEQHASNPSEKHPPEGPSPAAYDVPIDNPKYSKKSFNSSAVLGQSRPGSGFGSSAQRAALKAQEPTPGPGEYSADVHIGSKGANAPSSVFASGVGQRGANPTSYGDYTYNPEGVGTIKATGAPNKGFGGASRGLLDGEDAEVAELRAMLGKS
jgi:hypothetical protein